MEKLKNRDIERSEKPVKVLQILRGSGSYGGVASFLLSRYKYMDHNKIQFDFLFCQKNCIDKEKIEKYLLESRLDELNVLKEKNSILDYIILLIKVIEYLKKNRYSIVHINTGSLPVTLVCLLAASNVGVKKKIAHSHSSNYKNGKLNTKYYFLPVKKILQFFIYKYSDYQFACSKSAAENMFGSKCNYIIINNAIDTSQFFYNEVQRNKVRSEYNVKDKHVFGYVGRLSKSKNIIFLISIFKCILERDKQAVFWIIGDGEECENIRKEIIQLKLINNICLFGNREDVNLLMLAMDGLIFPSLYEGLSITLIEAQAVGLPVFASNTLSEEHKLTDLITFISLQRPASEWSEIVLSNYKKFERTDQRQALINAGYEIRDSVKELENYYLNT